MTIRSGWTGTVCGAPEVGMSAESSKTMTLKDVELFTAMTGDRNPLHYDEAVARESIFGGLIVQGGVTTGVLNAIVAEQLPGPGTVFLSMELKFPKAVKIGDAVTGRVTVKTVRSDKPICTVDLSVTNQHGEVCLSGTASTYTAPLRPYERVVRSTVT